MNTLTEKERQTIEETLIAEAERLPFGTIAPRYFKHIAMSVQYSLAELRKEEAPSEWVDINVRVPESGRCVLLYSKDGGVAEGAYNNVKGIFEQWRWNAIVNPTHWMYLPSPPSEEEAPSEKEEIAKRQLISELKRIGFLCMYEPNHYADKSGLSFVFEPEGRFTIANGRGDILCNADDYAFALKYIVSYRERSFNMEPIEKPSEDLVEQIWKIIDCNSVWNGRLCLQIVTPSSIRSASNEIAKLLTTDLLSSQMHQAGILEGKRQDVIEACKDYVDKNSHGVHFRDLECGFIAGAEWAFTDLRKFEAPSEDNRSKIQELLWVFSCDASADPKSVTEELIRLAQKCEPVYKQTHGRPNIKDFFGDVTVKEVHESYIKAPLLYDYMQALDNHIDELEYNLRKNEAPSEQLAKDLNALLWSNSFIPPSPDEARIYSSHYNTLCTEIAKLLTPDVNAELLAFAEWCSSNGWMLMNGESIFVPKGCWYDYDAWQDGEGVEQWYTTEELYEQFKNTQSK